jgi:hypothetical protein
MIKKQKVLIQLRDHSIKGKIIILLSSIYLFPYLFSSGYSGLLRNHKSVDEFGAGFDTSKKLPKKLKLANGNRKQSKLSLADRLKMSDKPNFKINKKRDMSVFDD